ncbi:glucose 1-dehydrogenase [Hymenobacter sp. BT664]|uniref:Glucose 1-dehydrogenase n=1 Tax=Hymenobacter montanus TaxID=2771359 RepID=A0A927BDK6_9BACT|nr:glucose 1-dehydrogenase [Hymenobacter montanus]MBD2768199.1 glucose 1-dehydrogenase [Hymenobacter montanus]
MRLFSKVALVTGSSKGIGKAIALKLAAEGADVIINYSSSLAEAQAVVADITTLGRKAVAIQADIAKPASIENLFQQALEAFEKIDIVVANAGYELIEIPFMEYTEEQFDKAFDINTKGTFFTMQQATKYISEGGRIIVISSNTTLLSLPGFSVYGGSKMTPKYFVEVLAKEIGKRGVTVNSVIPGVTVSAGVFTNTSTTDHYLGYIQSQTPLNRLGQPGDIAQAVAFLASREASFITGQHLVVDGGNSI